MKNTISSILALVFSFSLLAQQVPMYVGSYTSNGSEGVYLYRFNENTGKATFDRYFTLSNPSFIARNGSFLYTVNEDVEGGITAIDLNDGVVLNRLSTKGAHPCHVSISPIEPVIVVSNYSGGSLTLYSIHTDGSLNKQEDFIQFNNSSINTKRQNESHIHSAFFSSDGLSLFVSDLGADLIYRYAVDKHLSGYKFRFIEQIRTKVGGGPRHVVVSPYSDRLLVILELTGEVEVIEKSNDGWISKQVLSISKEGFSGTHGAADIKISSDGQYVYATNRGDANVVVVYKINREGLLIPIQVLSVEGVSPRNVQLSPNEKWIIISNQVSGTVNFFKRNIKTGKLSSLQHTLEIPSAVCVIF